MRAVLMATLALSSVAFAGDPVAPASTETPATVETPVTPAGTVAPTPGDCSGLEGEAKTTCEAAAPATPATPTTPDATAEVTEEPVAEKPTKGKAKRSKTNRLESETEDE